MTSQQHTAAARFPTPAAASPFRRGFTLLELTIVIGIMVVLVSILLPVVHKVRMKGYVADTSNEVSELSAAIERYSLDQHAYPGPLANDQICDPTFPNFNAGPLGGTTIAWPFANTFLDAQAQSGTALTGMYDANLTATTDQQITMSENLVLGLLGGLWVGPTGQYQLHYDPTQVGQGPQLLAQSVTPHRYPPYIETRNLDWGTNSNGKTGRFIDATGMQADSLGSAYDTAIPEFVDRFPNPLPILYLRAKPGPSSYNPANAPTAQDNPVITDDPKENATDGPRPGTYDINQIAGYTRTASSSSAGSVTPLLIGVGKESITPYNKGNESVWPNTTVPTPGLPCQGLNQVTPTASISSPVITSGSPPTTITNTGYNYPYDAYPYFLSSSSSAVGQGTVSVARNRDSFILISAGEDRIYGTNDDITSFGSVLPQ